MLQLRRKDRHLHTDLLAELYEARLAHRQAKAVHRAKADELGEPCNGEWLYHEHEGADWSGPCYYDTELAREEWCERCDTLQPLWEAYRATGRRAGKALRACTTRGRQIVERRKL